MADNERDIVLESLIQILEKGQFSHVVEGNVLDKYDYLDTNKKAFIKRVIEGTCENLIPIDEIINDNSSINVKKMKPLIRTLIRMSVYQILYMDKIPDSAACNEAVKLTIRHGFKNLSGFVNGLLRGIIRKKDSINKADILNNNIPDWICAHLNETYGKDKAKLIIDDINKAHPVTIRVRDKSMNVEGMTKCDLTDNAYRLSKGTNIKDTAGYSEGMFVVQDLASMMVVANSGIKEGDFVIDVCASPGGKSIQAYDQGAKVLSRDISMAKINIIDDNIKRCIGDSSERIQTEVHDATIIDENMIEKADVVIADVPCSGLGVMGRKADIRHKTNKEDLTTLPDIQKKIVDAVWKYVKKDGALMYSTCTMNKAENEDMVDYIINNYPFKIEYMKQFLPGIDGTDGFFIARLRKNND